MHCMFPRVILCVQEILSNFHIILNICKGASLIEHAVTDTSNLVKTEMNCLVFECSSKLYTKKNDRIGSGSDRYRNELLNDKSKPITEPGASGPRNIRHNQV